MAQIRIHTERVKEIGQRLTARGDLLAEMSDELQRAINSLDTGSWDGRSRHEAETLLNRVRPESTQLAEALDALGRTLMHVAEVFEREDNTAAHNLDGLAWVDFEISQGQILGISSGMSLAAPAVMLASTNVSLDEYRSRDLSKMSWTDRLALKDVLRKQIEELNKAQQRLEAQIAQDDQDITEIDRQIRKLQAQRDALQEEADKLSNKLKPDDDGLKWGFDDGILDAPWRTESDDLEDQMADLDQQIEDLQEQKQYLIAQREGHQNQLQGIDERLKSMQAEQEKLNGLLENGIAPDGPTEPAWLRNQLSGCTHYVAQKRDVSAWPNSSGEPGHPGNACEWDDQARQAGYGVGQEPVKGSIIVWEPGAKYTQDHNGYTVSTHSSAGHVAIVKDVDYSNPEVVRVRIEHASISQGRGTHSQPLDQWVTLDPSEVSSGDISFIYDKSFEASPNTI
jgi:WXG100 family type VII secretion target